MSVSDIAQDAQAHDYRRLVESIADIEIILLDPAGKILTWNPGAEGLTGYKASDVLGKSIDILYTETDRSNGLAAKELRIAADTGRCELEGWLVHKSGKLF